MKFTQFIDVADRMENISMLYHYLTCDPSQPSQRCYSYVTNVTAYGFCCQRIESCTNRIESKGRLHYVSEGKKNPLFI